MRETLTIRIPQELRKELERLSKISEKPVSDLVRDSIKRFIAIERFRRLRSMTLPFAEATGILTDEDVFKTLS